jgi:hypothetical protein
MASTPPKPKSLEELYDLQDTVDVNFGYQILSDDDLNREYNKLWEYTSRYVSAFDPPCFYGPIDNKKFTLMVLDIFDNLGFLQDGKFRSFKRRDKGGLEMSYDGGKQCFYGNGISDYRHLACYFSLCNQFHMNPYTVYLQDTQCMRKFIEDVGWKGKIVPTRSIYDRIEQILHPKKPPVRLPPPLPTRPSQLSQQNVLSVTQNI